MDRSSQVLRFFAHVVSVIFHPLFLISYGLVILLMLNPYLFATQNPRDLVIIIFYVFAISVIFPGITILMLYMLGMIDSIQLPDRKQRIVPLLICGTFYCWLYINMLNNNIVPAAFTSFVLGSTIGLFLAFFINLFSKISLHAVAISGLTVGMIIMKYHFAYEYFEINLGFGPAYMVDSNMIVFVGVFLMGLVGTARLVLDAHQPSELLGGYLVGIISQVIAMRILLF